MACVWVHAVSVCVHVCVLCVSVHVVHVGVCAWVGNRWTDGEFLWMINGFWKEALHPSDTPGRF